MPDSVHFKGRYKTVGQSKPSSIHIRNRSGLVYACAFYDGGHIVFGWFRTRADALTDFVQWIFV